MNSSLLTIWAYRTSQRGTTKFTPFSHVYRSVAVLPVKIIIPSTRLAVATWMNIEQQQLIDLELLEGKKKKKSNPEIERLRLIDLARVIRWTTTKCTTKQPSLPIENC